MTHEPYVLASSDTVIVLARDVGEGTFRVTAWIRGKEEKVDRAGACVCAQHAAGQWCATGRIARLQALGNRGHQRARVL